jgi:DNA-binding transcriptional LysR family regulator
MHFRMLPSFDWNRARAFWVTAELGSFSAAARVLGVAQPTVGRQVAALEEELGVVLFERVGNALELTASGVELVDHVRAMAGAASRISLTAAGQSEAIDGTVCITASEIIAAYLLPPILIELRRTQPGIELEILASNSIRDLLRREADIAIRNVAPTHPELFARKLGDHWARPYASAEYLARIGDPQTPAALAEVGEFFAFDRTTVMIDGLRERGLEFTPRNFPIITSNHLVQWQMAKRGAGICFVMEAVGDAEPGMVRVLPELPPLPVPIWLVSHRELRTSRRIRLVFDALAAGLAAPCHESGRSGPRTRGLARANP